MTTSSGSPTCLVRHRVSSDGALRLFCFPFAGAGASAYRDWLAWLPAEVDVLAVQLPGRESRIREAPCTSLPALVEPLLEAMADHMAPPCVFFGHSMGALVAFELTRALRRAGQAGPARLLVSGRHAPQLPDRRPPRYRKPDAELIGDLRELAGTSDTVLANPELMELLLPIIRADLTVCDTYTYVPEPPLYLPIAAFGGREDAETDAVELAAWRAQTVGEFRMHLLPGGHFYFRAQAAAFFARVTEELRPLLWR